MNVINHYASSFYTQRKAYSSFKVLQLLWSERVSASNDRNDIDTRAQTTHELNIDFTETFFEEFGSVHIQIIKAGQEILYAWPVGEIKYNKA